MSAIKPGDLVMVVRPKPCCGYSGSLGLVRRVEEWGTPAMFCHCAICGVQDVKFDRTRYAHLGNNDYVLRTRLKKLDPPALADDVERVRELENV